MLYPTKPHKFTHKISCTFASRKQHKFEYMEEKNVSFNDMPRLMAVMCAKLNELGNKVDKLMPTEKKEEQQWFNVSSLIEYLPNHPAEQTIYGWTSARKIPFHKRGKSILFNKEEIDQWLSNGTYRKSEHDLECEAMSYVNSKRYGKH